MPSEPLVTADTCGTRGAEPAAGQPPVAAAIPAPTPGRGRRSPVQAIRPGARCGVRHEMLQRRRRMIFSGALGNGGYMARI